MIIPIISIPRSSKTNNFNMAVKFKMVEKSKMAATS